MHGYLYAIYDENNRLIKTYANYTWAKRKASRNNDWRIETFVRTSDRKLIEIEEFITRKDG